MKTIALCIALAASAAFAQGASMNCRFGSSCNVGSLWASQQVLVGTTGTLQLSSNGTNSFITNNGSIVATISNAPGTLTVPRFLGSNTTGNNSFEIFTTGSRMDLGPGGSDYLTSDGANTVLVGASLQVSTGATLFIEGTSTAKNTSSDLKLRSGVIDGASAVAVSIDTTNTLSTAGSKILSNRNATVEKSFIDKDGALGAPSGAATVAGGPLGAYSGAGGAASGATPAGAGGALTITTGAGGAASTTAGGTSANAGSVTITGGNGGAAATNNSAGGVGGGFTVTGGTGGAGLAATNNFAALGGSINLTGGTGGTSRANGGSINILSGNGGAANGTASQGSQGSVNIDIGPTGLGSSINIGTNTDAAMIIGRSGGTSSLQIAGKLAFNDRSILVDKVSSGIGAGSLLATGTNYSGFNLKEPWTLTHLSLNVTTASSATAANTVFTATDGTNTCTFTFACNTVTNTTGVKDATATNGAGTGCVYAAAANVTLSVTTQGCATAVTTNSIGTWGKPQ